VRPLPAGFLAALAESDEVLVTSREGAVRGTVPTWFLIDEPAGVVYLFTLAFSLKARRWRNDPWVRLSLPGTRASAEGVAHVVAPEAIDDALAERIVEHWAMQGAPTVEGLRRGLRDGMYVLVRVEGLPQDSD
jgi:hypothetical protein